MKRTYELSLWSGAQVKGWGLRQIARFFHIPTAPTEATTLIKEALSVSRAINESMPCTPLLLLLRPLCSLAAPSCSLMLSPSSLGGPSKAAILPSQIENGNR